MTSNPSLTYYTPDTATRRPAALTVAAITGIVLGVLLILIQSMASIQNSVRNGPVRLPTVTRTDWTAVGFLFGVLLRTLATLMMVIACSGVLGLRRNARLAAIVTAYAWMVMGALDIFTTVYALTAMAGRSPVAGSLVISVSLAVLFEIAFPAFLMITLRRKGIAELFGRPSEVSDPPRAVAAAVAVVLLVFASAGVLDGLIGVIANMTSPQGTFHRERLISVAALQGGGMWGLDAFLWFLLMGGLIAGSLMVLKRQNAGGWLIVICAIAKITFVVGAWSMSNDIRSYVSRWMSGPGVRSSAQVYWLQIDAISSLFSIRITTLLWPVLVLVAFTRRSAERVEEFATEPVAVSPPIARRSSSPPPLKRRSSGVE